MHEASAAQEIYNIVDQTIQENELHSVSKVFLEVGEFSCIQADQLSYFYHFLTEGTIQENAVLEVKRTKATAYCPVCKKTFSVMNVDLICPVCGTSGASIESGFGMEIKCIEGE